MYIIYGATTSSVDTNDPANIIAQRVQGTEYIYAPIFPWNRKTRFAVTAIDRYGNESESVQQGQ